ncbi:MAG: hypothetical protein HFE46_07650 [Clostridia bacterium]|nr:hypothetical protein [Clostridia bacterium]
MQESEPYIITKSRTVRKILWGRIAAVVFAVCILVIGGVLWLSRTPRAITAKARTYRLVAVGDYKDLGEASMRAQAAVRSGGAGYLYGESSYTVAVACYASAADADAVCERLRAEDASARVVSVSCAALTLDRPAENADTVKKMLVRPAALFDELYAVSLQTDTKEISAAAAKYAALKMHVACVEYAEICRRLQTDTGEYLSALFLSLADTLQTPADASENVAAALKYALCDMAVKICAHTEAFIDKNKKL